MKKAKRLLREALSFPDEKMETRFKTTMDARSLSIVVTTLSIVVPAFCTVLAVIYLLNPRDPLILQFGIPGLSCTLMYLIYGKLGAQNIIFFDILAFTSQSSMFWAAKYEEGYPLYLLLFPVQQMMLVLIQPHRCLKHMASFIIYMLCCEWSLQDLSCPDQVLLCSFRDRSHYLFLVIGSCVMVSGFTSEMLSRHLYQHRQREALQRRTEQILSYLSHNLRNPLMVGREQLDHLISLSTYPKEARNTMTEIKTTLDTFGHVLDNCLEFQSFSKWDAWEDGPKRAAQIVRSNLPADEDSSEAKKIEYVTSVDYFFNNESKAFKFSESDGNPKKKTDTPSTPVSPIPLPKLSKIQRILHADDNTLILKVIERMIYKYDPNIAYQSAVNGKLVVDEFLSRPPDFFDLVLMDIVMPVMDGHEAAQQLRKLGYKGLIIALTANASEMQGKHCLDSGINMVMVKPVENQKLKDLFIQLCSPEGAQIETSLPSPKLGQLIASDGKNPPRFIKLTGSEGKKKV